jgi:hypothetical protein
MSSMTYVKSDIMANSALHVGKTNLVQERFLNPPHPSTMSRRNFFACAAAICLLSSSMFAQASPVTPSPVGVWRGTSLCQIRPSSCNDETVVYRISRASSVDSVLINGRRVVNGQEVEMGALGCAFAPAGAQITCTIPSGVWRFTMRADSLTGELRSKDNTKLRDVRTVRSR